MKHLDIDERTEQLLVAVFDAALKANGMSINAAINEISLRVKEVPPKPPIEEIPEE